MFGNLFELILGDNFHVGKWRNTDLSYIINVGIISPILFFYINTIFNKYLNFKNNLFLIFKAVVIISIGLFIIYTFDINSQYSFMLWQFIIALWIQFILYKEDFKITFQEKNI